MLVFLFMIVSFGLYAFNLKTVVAKDIPPIVGQLNNTIISATEQDVESEDAEMNMERLNQDDPVKLLKFGLESVGLLWQHRGLPRNGEFITTEFENLLQDIDEEKNLSRGKFRKRRKMRKYFYNFVVGLLIAKSVILPLILKILMALVSVSFVMSKIALMTSALLALRWLLSTGDVNVSGNRRAKLEVIHLPAGTNAVRPYNGGGGVDNLENWANDKEWIDSKFRGREHIRQYIPLGGTNNRYTHNNYDSIAINEGKPFL